MFYIFYFFIRLFGLLPFGVLYAFSSVLYLLFYYVIPYRRKVIRQNIERSFPNIDQKEKKRIIKGFYRNLCDILVEGIKGFTMTERDLRRRYVFINPEVMNDLFEKGQNVVSVGAHYANWEWGIMAAPLQLKHKLYALYTPLSNKPIDEYMRKNRKKWGMDLVPSREVKRMFSASDDKPATYFFGADQSPANPRGSHWMEFMNQDTACMKGPEFFARRYRLPVVYFDVQRIKRGYYTVTLKMLEMDPVNTSSGEITENYMRTLERLILNKPEDYLWSHRRWKHSGKNDKT